MIQKDSSVGLGIWSIYVCLIVTFSLSPTASGFPKEVRSFDSKVMSDFNEEIIEQNTTKHDSIGRSDPCIQRVCLNGGKCIVEGDGTKCACEKPYVGDMCETVNCFEVGCLHGGRCFDDPQYPQCECNPPYGGIICEQGGCSNYPCQNGGKCRLEGHSPVCECEKPFEGIYCHSVHCSEGDCLNGGKCVDGNCECKEPYHGILCELDPCSEHKCENGGKCYLDGNEAKCECEEPYFGSQCEDATCSESNCLNGGKCEPYERNCRCDMPYSGPLCNRDPCSNFHECQNGGKCVFSHIHHPMCECEKPYFGMFCEYAYDISTLKSTVLTTIDIGATRNLTDTTKSPNEPPCNVTEPTSTSKPKTRYILRNIYAVHNITELIIEEKK